MGDEAASSPVLKITIKQEAAVAGEPRYSMRSESLTTPTIQTDVSANAANLNPECQLSPKYSASNYVKCAVPSCNNYFDGQRFEFMGISYFPFPDDADLRKEWMIAIELPPDTPSENMKVCSNHFLTQDFASKADAVVGKQESEVTCPTQLNPNAKPSVNIPKKTKANVSKKSIMAMKDAMYDASGQFIGLDNPLMDTSKDVFAARSTTSKSRGPGPVITGVHSMSQLGCDEGDGDVLESSLPGASLKVGRHQTFTSSQSKKPRSRKIPRQLADPLSGDEIIIASDDSGTDVRPTSKNPERGLIVVPASVKLPPRLPKVDLVGDSFGDDNPSPAHKKTALCQEIPPEVEPSCSKRAVVPDDQLLLTSKQLDEPKTIEEAGELGTRTQSDESGATKPPDYPVSNKQLDAPGTSKHSDNPRAEKGPDEPAAIGSRAQFRFRRKRRNREEMRREEEEDEWEPSFWRKRTLVREGFGEQLKADEKRKINTKLKYTREASTTGAPGPSTMNCSPRFEDEGLLREDEGWRVVEPISVRKDESDSEISDDDCNNPLSLLEVSLGDENQEQPPVRRRPGPASKTCRPSYTPPKARERSENNGVDSDGVGSLLSDGAERVPETNDTPGNGKQPEVDVYNSSLLVDWCFFKSLIPDMGRLSIEKRMHLKTFILDTLNARIYEGKPINLQESEDVAPSVAIAE